MAMAAAHYLKKKLYDPQTTEKQLDMSKEEFEKLRRISMTDVEANRCLRQGIRTAEEGREIDFREGFPRMESLEFKKLFAMGR